MALKLPRIMFKTKIAKLKFKIAEIGNRKKQKMLFSFIFSMFFPIYEAANFRTRMFLSHHNTRRRSTSPDLTSHMIQFKKMTKNIENAQFMEKVCTIKTCFKCEKALIQNIHNGFCKQLTTIDGCCDEFNSQQAF